MARIAIGAIVRDIERIIGEEVVEFEQEVREHMRGAYEKIQGDSPFITYYYKANHFITIRRGGSPLFGNPAASPPVRESDEPGFYESDAIERMFEELGKLSAYEIGDTIVISNEAEYATAVEAKHGVYAGAAEAFRLKQR